MTALFEFKKFKPSLSLSKHMSSVLLQMMDFIPSGATASASISKFKNKYKCFIEVTAPKVRFVQNILCERPEEGLDKLMESIKREIGHWQVEHMIVTEPTFWDFKEVKV